MNTENMNGHAYPFSCKLAPYILEETIRGIQPISIEDHMLKKREIFLTENVTPESSVELIKQLVYLEQEAPGEEVTLYINSPGGEVTSGLAIYDYIQLMKSPLHTVCIGTAASMGAILFLSGEKRSMLPHTQIMIHDPSFAAANMSHQKPLEIQTHLNMLMNTRKILAEIIAERTGMSLKQVYSKTKNDTFLTAEEALKLGVATHILK